MSIPTTAKPNRQQRDAIEAFGLAYKNMLALFGGRTVDGIPRLTDTYGDIVFVHAIKAIREATGMGLREAKGVYDAMAAKCVRDAEAQESMDDFVRRFYMFTPSQRAAIERRLAL